MNASTVAAVEDFDIEKAPHSTVSQPAMKSSCLIEQEGGQDAPPLELLTPPMDSFPEPQIERWRLVSLYVR
jgi:hypothetical protein